MNRFRCVAGALLAVTLPCGAQTGAAQGSGNANANAFNPAISLILSGRYTRTSRDPAGATIAGFALPADAEVGAGPRGFSLGESELGVAASIDPWWRGAATFALRGDNTGSVEEAFVQTTALGNGVSAKAGRTFANIGYLNPQHAHAWDFVDNPLAYQALLGTQLGNDGVQLTWIAPLDRYLEVGAELGRATGFPGGDITGNGASLHALSLRTGGDVGDSHDWRAGVSLLGTRADGQRLAATDAAGRAVTNAFSGRSRVWIAEGVWKWAPQGNATRTSLKLQGEVLRGTRDGRLAYDVAGVDSADRYRAVQSGWYVQGVYQFMPRWRVGLRTERLDAGTPDYGLNAAALSTPAAHPSKHSLMVDWSPSEFSRIRAQLARDRSRGDGRVDNQLSLQYQMSLGAHGAHGY
ncbi:MAG: hypothetical protein U1E89_05980 [Burkholderiaceae bacterium]